MISVLRCALAVVAAAVCAVPAAGQPSKSAPLAVELVQQFEQRKLQNVAAKDPEQPGVFVAASYVSGVQLLVVSARSAAPEYVDYVLAASRYDEVYASLNGSAVPEGRLFIQDMGLDGLMPKPENGRPIDIAYREADKIIIFNGEWKKQGLKEREYTEAFEAIDARYAKALSLLIAKLKGPAGH